MAEEVKEAVPADAPWLLDWKTVATKAGTIDKKQDEPPKVDKGTQKPWQMDWRDVYKEEKPVRPTSSFNAAGGGSSGFNMASYTAKLTSTESGGNDNAKAATSSATGPHQFIDSTWNETVKKMGADYSLADRTDRAKSTKVLERFTRDNIAQAKEDLGRTPTMTEAYMYHFIGASAPKLIKAPKDAPAKDFITPEQYNANKSVFAGKTVGEVMSKYGKRFGETSSISREGEHLDKDNEPIRSVYDKLPKMAARDVIATGLATVEGQASYEARWKAEHASKIKGMTTKQKDSFHTNWDTYAAEKDPEKFEMFSRFKALGEMPESVRSYLEKHNPDIVFSTKPMSGTKGFVFDGSGDRVFLNKGADYNTMVHEAEHLRQQQDFKKTGQAHDARFYKKGLFSTEVTPIRELADVVGKDRSNPAFKEVWRASNAYDGPAEFMANFVGYMKTSMKEGQSWSDTGLYKELTKKVGEKKAQSMLIDMITTVARDNMKEKK